MHPVSGSELVTSTSDVWPLSTSSSDMVSETKRSPVLGVEEALGVPFPIYSVCSPGSAQKPFLLKQAMAAPSSVPALLSVPMAPGHSQGPALLS